MFRVYLAPSKHIPGSQQLTGPASAYNKLQGVEGSTCACLGSLLQNLRGERLSEPSVPQNSGNADPLLGLRNKDLLQEILALRRNGRAFREAEVCTADAPHHLRRESVPLLSSPLRIYHCSYRLCADSWTQAERTEQRTGSPVLLRSPGKDLWFENIAKILCFAFFTAVPFSTFNFEGGLRNMPNQSADNSQHYSQMQQAQRNRCLAVVLFTE